LKTPDNGGVLRGDISGKDPGGSLGQYAYGIDSIFNGERNAVKRTKFDTTGHSLVCGFCAPERLIRHQGHDRVHLRVYRGDAIQMRLNNCA
jgi:hypothetical protein